MACKLFYSSKESVMKTAKEDCDHMLHRYILVATLIVLLLVFIDQVVFG